MYASDLQLNAHAPSNQPVRCIAVVEDRQEDAWYIHHLLKSGFDAETYDITVFSSIREALTGLARKKFDLVMVNENVQGENALTLVEHLGGVSFQSPFVMMTDISSESMAQSAMNRGVMDYLEKRELTAALLKRSIAFAIRHHQILNVLDDARTKAEEANLAKGRFMAMMSHDLRTPLNAIIGAAQVLKTAPLNDTYMKLVRNIENGGRTLNELLTDILDVTRLSENKLTLRNDPFSPRQLLTEVANLFSEQAKSNGIGFLVKCGKSVPDQVMGDGGRFRQILFNLAGNAIKFTAEGEVRMSLELVSSTPKAHLLQLTVSDTGPGIPAEDQARIFKPFEQRSQTKETHYQGSGLGLAIVKKMVELFRGSLELQSEEGNGTIFVVRVPFAKVESIPSEDQGPQMVEALM